jgi:hypothetical protein
MTSLRSRSYFFAAAVGLLSTAACSEFLTVENANFVDADDIDPVSDATTLSRSALQNFASAYGQLVVDGGLFTGEMLSSDINSPGNRFSTRNVDNQMGTQFASLSRARTLGDRLLDELEGTPGASSVNAALAAMVSGYSMLAMAEYFCVGTINGGPPLTPVMMLDTAVARFTKAIDVARTLSGAEATQVLNASLVGRARAHLQAGRAAQAIADAGQVAAGFNYNLVYVDDLANRGRLGNGAWAAIFSQTTWSVAPPYRQLNDARVVTIAPAVNKLVPMDGLTAIWSLSKYNSFASPIRLASKLEADYVTAEAQGSAAMLALIASRRAANGQPAYSGPTDDTSVRVEFLHQKTLEFFAEGKRMADYRRHTDDLPNVQPAGTEYHKPGYEPYADQTCLPLPFRETANNPHFNP